MADVVDLSLAIDDRALEPSLSSLAQAMDDVIQRVNRGPTEDAPGEITRAAVELLGRATWASVTMLEKGKFRSLSPTAEAAMTADQLQYELGSGPCVDAVLDDGIYVTGDIAADGRWPAYGHRVQEEVGVWSMAAYRLAVPEDLGVIAGLNLYSVEPDAFDEQSVWLGLLLATHASLAVSAQLAHEEVGNLQQALQSNRDIGVAIGVLMARHGLTRDQAFDLLRVASQDRNRKLVDIAADVAESGELAISHWPKSGRQNAL
ncbi:MAG: GAF and ANTAR domain-containing protein [Nostocoides sp.]